MSEDWQRRQIADGWTAARSQAITTAMAWSVVFVLATGLASTTPGGWPMVAVNLTTAAISVFGFLAALVSARNCRRRLANLADTPPHPAGRCHFGCPLCVPTQRHPEWN